MSPAPPFLDQLLGVRAKPPHLPNTSDSNSEGSIRIARHILEGLGLEGNRGAPESQRAGALMERLVAEHLESELEELAPDRDWLVHHPGRKVSSFEQYDHLATLQQIIDDDETGVLGTAIGREYEVAPDVTVGVMVEDGEAARPVLHASVSCKLTLRSDRAQNVRQESAILIRQRRGRLPHIVAITVEPLPARIASIARGSGDVDAVYHMAFDQLVAAVDAEGSDYHASVLDELVGQRRLLDYSRLAETLAST